MKNYKDFLDYCQSIAADVNSYSDDVEVTDRIHEIADGSQYVIYYSKAWDLVNMIREYDHELFLRAAEELQDYALDDGDINTQITFMSYFLIRDGIRSAYESKQVKEEVA